MFCHDFPFVEFVCLLFFAFGFPQRLEKDLKLLQRTSTLIPSSSAPFKPLLEASFFVARGHGMEQDDHVNRWPINPFDVHFGLKAKGFLMDFFLTSHPEPNNYVSKLDMRRVEV